MTNVVGPVTDPVDPWAIVASDKYDPDTVFLRATDQKGHSVNVQCPVSTNIYGQVQAIVTHPHTKYRSVQDFIRDAVAHRLRYWVDVEKSGRIEHLPGAAEAYETERMRSLLDQIRTRGESAGQLVRDTEHAVQSLLRAGKWMDAAELLDRLDVLLESWTDLAEYERIVEQIARMRKDMQGRVGS